jgi:hypothetical protein
MSCGTGWTTLKTNTAAWATIAPYIAACPDIAISSTIVSDGVAAGTAVGTLSMINGFGVYSYTITSQTPAVYFQLVGDVLQVLYPPNFAANPAIVVTISADNGLAADPVIHAFTITVIGGGLGDGSVNMDEDGNPIALGAIF